MNRSTPSDSVQHKLFALCEHLEELCARSSHAMISGETDGLDDWQKRKDTVLEEFARLLALPDFAGSADLARAAAHRVKSAIQAELRVATAAAAALRTELTSLPARAQQLDKLRGSYGASDFLGHHRTDLNLATIETHG